LILLFVTLQKFLVDSPPKKFYRTFLKPPYWFWPLFYLHKFSNKNSDLRQFEGLIARISRREVITTLSIVVFLMFINWLLESLKWQYLSRRLVISVWEAVEAVFCGLTWAIFTPNRIGEYGGRVMFLPNRKRIHGVFAMAVGAFAQNVITNVGCFSLPLVYLLLF
jgi:uncharacterized membrane protein YbhN (UPF0104 family)